MNKSTGIGAGIIAILLAAVVFFSTSGQSIVKPETPAITAPAPQKQLTVVTALITGDWVETFEDRKVLNYLREKGIDLRYRQMSDADMIAAFTDNNGRLKDIDLMLPTDELLVGRIKEADKANKSRETFYTYFANSGFSRTAILSWSPVVEALAKDRTFYQEGATYFADTPKLLEKINKNTSWNVLGLPYNGRVEVIPPDPRYSGTGVSWLGIITESYMRGKTYESRNLDNVQPQINSIFPQGIRLAEDPKELLDKYITGGENSLPMIVASEHALIEYARSNPAAIDTIKEKMRVIYPRPTISAPHPIITKTDPGRDFAVMLQYDPELRKLIRVEHGMRTKEVDPTDDRSTLTLLGIPGSVNEVGIPPAGVVDHVLSGLQN